jgi:hypothetical protein
MTGMALPLLAGHRPEAVFAYQRSAPVNVAAFQSAVRGLAARLPQRQYIVNLAGSGQLEVAEGKVDLPPGSMEFIDDLTGKGHTTRIMGTEDRVSIWLKFEDQKQHIGPLNARTTTSAKP